MSTYAIDSARTSERLSAFMSEIAESEPVDNYFTKTQTLDYFWGKKKVKNGGRQVIGPIDTDENDTVAWGSHLDLVSTNEQDTVTTAGYAYKSIRGSVVISKDELRETAGDKHKIFDMLQQKRNNIMLTMRDKLNKAFYNESVGSDQMESLHSIIKATGTVGGLSAAAETTWKSTVTTGVGDWGLNGMGALRTLRTTLVEAKSRPDGIFTAAGVFNAFEANIDVDVRYTDVSGDGTGKRGFKTLEYAGMPLIFDGDCAADDLYMVDSDLIYLNVDSEGMMVPEPFQKPVNQFAQVSLVETRLMLVTFCRRGLGKLEGITY